MTVGFEKDDVTLDEVSVLRVGSQDPADDINRQYN
jgi:hypothetical protein